MGREILLARWALSCPCRVSSIVMVGPEREEGASEDSMMQRQSPGRIQAMSGRWRAASIRFPESFITFPNSGVILTEPKVLDWPKCSFRL